MVCIIGTSYSPSFDGEDRWLQRLQMYRQGTKETNDAMKRARLGS